MMNRTKIEYLDYTWNPLAMRCTPISEGCAHCWHLRMCDRLAGNKAFSVAVRNAYQGGGPPVLIQERLEDPLRRRKPGRIGVQFMGDLFHEDVDPRWIADIWRAMYYADQHTFLVLTKRPGRMYQILSRYPAEMILPNVWLGITAENQQRAHERIPLLL